MLLLYGDVKVKLAQKTRQLNAECRRSESEKWNVKARFNLYLLLSALQILVPRVAICISAINRVYFSLQDCFSEYFYLKRTEFFVINNLNGPKSKNWKLLWKF